MIKSFYTQRKTLALLKATLKGCLTKDTMHVLNVGSTYYSLLQANLQC
jgi:hypothetical protein